MAQPDDTRRTTTANAPRPQTSPGTKTSKTLNSPHSQRLQGQSSSWSPISSPKVRRNHDHDDHGNHHNKKSVFMKVKEKAKKLKKSLSGRRRREENEQRSPYFTPPGSTAPVEDERSEYFGSPMSGPPTAKADNKGSFEKHDLTSNTERESAMTTAADSLVETTDSKLSGLTISTREGTETANKHEGNEPKENNTRSSPQQQDKGVSVKEYLMHKLEPGEDERALSQVITQTISPRCEKMKEAMNSLLKTEEPSQSTTPKTSKSELDITPAASDSNQNIGDTLATESPNMTISSLSSSANPNTLEPSPGSTSESLKNQNIGSNADRLNPNQSLSASVHGDTGANATQVPTSVNNHEG